MISNYLKELIEDNNRIIIPDFGAFMIQDTPEGKQISFNDFLKFNDGLLVNQIIKSEKISKNEATEKITAFVKAVEKSFSENKAFEVKGVGFLTKDAHGNIKFEIKPGAEATPSASPTDVKPTIVLDEEPTKAKEAAKPAEPKISEPAKEAKTTAPKTEPVKPEAKPEVKAPAKPEVKTASPTTSAGAGSTATPPKPKTTTPTPPKPTTTAKPATSASSSNARNLIIILAAVIIIAGGGTWAFFKFNLRDKFFSKEPVVEAPVQIQVTEPAIDSTTMDTATEMEVVEEPMVIEEPEETVETYQKKYYIVAGSFKVPSNAERYNKKLIDEGYASDIVARKNGFKVVSYKVVYTWGDALTEWKSMRQINPETWIFIK